MRNLLVAVVVIASLFALVGCDEGSTPVSVMKDGQTRYDMTVCVTNGNNSYIPLNFYRCDPDEKVQEILGALKAFEEAHPDLEVVYWSVEKQQWAHATTARVSGIWVHHRKVKLPPEAK